MSTITLIRESILGAEPSHTQRGRIFEIIDDHSIDTPDDIDAALDIDCLAYVCTTCGSIAMCGTESDRNTQVDHFDFTCHLDATFTFRSYPTV